MFYRIADETKKNILYFDLKTIHDFTLTYVKFVQSFYRNLFYIKINIFFLTLSIKTIL